MSTTRTAYHREWARRKRRAAWAREAIRRDVCPAALGNGVRCRWPLTNRVVNGETVPFCAQCDRKARGVCLDCQRAPVAGRAGRSLRCADCKRLAKRATNRRHYYAHHERVKRQARRQMARRRKLTGNRYAKLYRQAFPEKVRAAKRRHLLKQPSRIREYNAAYKAKHGNRRTGPRPCLTCETIVSGKAKKCASCRARALTSARQALAAYRQERAA